MTFKMKKQNYQTTTCYIMDDSYLFEFEEASNVFIGSSSYRVLLASQLSWGYHLYGKMSKCIATGCGQNTSTAAYNS